MVEKKEPKLKGRKVEVVTYGDYVAKVREAAAKKGGFVGDIRREAIKLLYAENIVIDKISVKGEPYYVVEA